MSEYPKYPSIERFENIYSIISEKVDGTNGLIEIEYDDGLLAVRFGSRNRWLTLSSDNAGFMNFFAMFAKKIAIVPDILRAKAVNELDNRNKVCSNPIRIYGEWYGKGIQRGYGLDTKYFMPFHTILAEALIEANVPNIMPPHIMYTGKFDKQIADDMMNLLRTHGSGVTPGYFNPEGIVVYFPTYQFCLKDTFEGAKWKLQS